MAYAKKLLLATTMLFPTLGQANIQISPMKVLLKNAQPGIITVVSKGTTTQYMKGSLVEVHNPGTAQESETPARQGSENSLVITPLKFALPAGNSQTVRVVSLGSGSEEQFYRAYFQSMTPEQMNSAEQDKNYQTSLSVSLVWGVIVMVPPANPVISVSYNPHTRQLNNNGNVHIFVKRIGVCPTSADDSACSWKDIKKSIYPHQPLTAGLAEATRIGEGNLRLDYRNDYTGKESTLSIPLSTQR